MRRRALLLVGLTAVLGACRSEPARPEPIPPPISSRRPTAAGPPVALPPPATSGVRSLEEVLAARRSRRELGARPLTLAELGQLAWAAQGITDPERRLRVTPSAGALYPLELYLVTAEGLFHYRPEGHAFARRRAEDLRAPLAGAALEQGVVRQAPCVAVLTAVTARTAQKYGDRAERFVALEAGHAAQDLLLQATSLGLAGVPVGAFDDAAVRRVLALPAGETPLYLVAIGAPPDDRGR